MEDLELTPLPKPIAKMQKGDTDFQKKINEIIEGFNALLKSPVELVEVWNKLPSFSVEQDDKGKITFVLDELRISIPNGPVEVGNTPVKEPDVVKEEPVSTSPLSFLAPKVAATNGTDKFLYEKVIPKGAKCLVRFPFNSPNSTRIAFSKDMSTLVKDLYKNDILVHIDNKYQLVVNNRTTGIQLEREGDVVIEFTGITIKVSARIANGEYMLAKEIEQPQQEMLFKSYKGMGPVIVETQGL